MDLFEREGVRGRAGEERQALLVDGPHAAEVRVCGLALALCGASRAGAVPRPRLRVLQMEMASRYVVYNLILIVFNCF